MKRDMDKKKKKAQKKSALEAYILSIMEKSLKAAMDKALDELLKEWK